jgi:hypothetical protein
MSRRLSWYLALDSSFAAFLSWIFIIRAIYVSSFGVKQFFEVHLFRKQHQILSPNAESHELALDGSTWTFSFLRSIVKVNSLQVSGILGGWGKSGMRSWLDLNLQLRRCCSGGQHDKT